jgi:hypothetical protein
MSSSEDGVKMAEGTFADASLHLCISFLNSPEEGSVKIPLSWESDERRLEADSVTGDAAKPIFAELHQKQDLDGTCGALSAS